MLRQVAPSRLQAEQIQRALHIAEVAIAQMQVRGRRLQVAVSEKQLDGAQMVTSKRVVYEAIEPSFSALVGALLLPDVFVAVNPSDCA